MPGDQSYLCQAQAVLHSSLLSALCIDNNAAWSSFSAHALLFPLPLLHQGFGEENALSPGTFDPSVTVEEVILFPAAMGLLFRD